VRHAIEGKVAAAEPLLGNAEKNDEQFLRECLPIFSSMLLPPYWTPQDLAGSQP
jgi:hypothetical protein